MVILARQNTFEATNGFFQRYVFTRRTGEYFCNVERLRQKALNFTCTSNGLLIFFREFIHTQNRNNIFQLFEALQYGLNATCYVVMLLTNDQWIQLTRSRVQWRSEERRVGKG